MEKSENNSSLPSEFLTLSEPLRNIPPSHKPTTLRRSLTLALPKFLPSKSRRRSNGNASTEQIFGSSSTSQTLGNDGNSPHHQTILQHVTSVAQRGSSKSRSESPCSSVWSPPTATLQLSADLDLSNTDSMDDTVRVELPMILKCSDSPHEFPSTAQATWSSGPSVPLQLPPAVNVHRNASAGASSNSKPRSPTLEGFKQLLSFPSWSPSWNSPASQCQTPCEDSTDRSSPMSNRSYFSHISIEENKICRLESSDKSAFFEQVESQRSLIQEEYNCDEKEIDLVLDPEYAPYNNPTTARFTRDDDISNNELAQSSSARKHVFLEIINTEKNYIGDLRRIVWLRGRIMVSGLLAPFILQRFIPPVLREILQLHESIAMSAFRLAQARPIVALNTNSVIDLQDVEQNEMSLVNAFVVLVENKSQKLYQKYCKIYPKLLKSIEKLFDPQSNQYSKDLIDLMAKHNYTASFVEGVLISPIQRITRYQLLLGEYKKTAAAEGRDNCVKKLDVFIEGLSEMIGNVDKCS